MVKLALSTRITHSNHQDLAGVMVVAETAVMVAVSRVETMVKARESGKKQEVQERHQRKD